MVIVIKVVAALIEKNGKYLIARRSTGSSDVLGKWEFPGGKVEKEESEEHAIERKIREEFEMNVKCIRFLVNNVCEYPSKTIDVFVKVISLSHGTRVWKDNQDELFKDGKINIYNIISNREDVYEYLIQHSIEHDIAIDIVKQMSKARTSKSNVLVTEVC